MFKNIVILLAIFNATLFADSCNIAEKGKAKVAIVIRQDAEEPVKFAAAELQYYLERITGCDFKITNSKPKNMHAIYLGNCKEAKTAGIDISEIKRDGYVITALNNDLFVVGIDDSGEIADITTKLNKIKKASFSQLKQFMAPDSWAFQRGTLYGVYRLLEHFGVRWFMPGAKGERIIKTENLNFSGLIKEAPHFIVRRVGGWYTAPYAYNKNKKRNKDKDMSEPKVLDFNPATNILWALRMRCESAIFPMSHRPPSLGWTERFGKKHPEYFALLANGKRDLDLKDRSYRSHLCYTNPDVLAETTKEIKAYRSGKHASELNVPERTTRRYPNNRGWSPNVAYGKYFSILPHDSFRACHCPKCSLLATPEGTSYDRQNSKMVWTFVEQYAKKIKPILPDQKLVCLAYSSYSHPYEGMNKLPDNVIVGLCTAYLNRPFNLYRPGMYSDFEKTIENWDNISTEPLAFWLHFLYRWARPQRYAVPVHIPDMYNKVIKKMAKHGRWTYIQLNEDSIMYEIFNRYMLMRMLYSPELNYKELFEDYLNRFYGPKAASVIRNIYDQVEKACIGSFKKNAGRIVIWEEFFTPDMVVECRKMVDKATELAKGSEYEEAVGLFSKYYVGLLEKGAEDFDIHVRQVMKNGTSKGCICKKRSDIKLDGILDEEAWKKPTRALRLVNNVTGKRTLWETTVNPVRAKDALYFGFTCYDPNAMKRKANKEMTDNSVEIFLDPDHNHNSYYQLLIDMTGKITDIYYEGNGEKGNHGWNSKAETAVKVYPDRWVLEVKIPRSVFPENTLRPLKPWGANFCRTINVDDLINKDDRFSSWSKMIRGSFHQPDLFGHLIFQN